MEDKVNKQFFSFFWKRTQKRLSYLLANDSAASTDRQRSAVRPHISLKARMLGEQAKTVVRQGDLMR